MADADKETQPAAQLGQAEGGGERCASCGAGLARDQRYCLNCGLRRGAPRIDFTGFWAGASSVPARGPGGNGGNGQDERGIRTPSRRLSGALATAMLALGIVGGLAIGPAAGAGSGAALAGVVPTLLASLHANSATPAPSPAAPSSSSAATQPEEIASAPTRRRHRRRRRLVQATTPAESGTSENTSESTPNSGNTKKKKTSTSGSGEQKPVAKPPITHVWVIDLSQGSFAKALEAPTEYPYLTKTLVPQGTLLGHYALVANGELANDVALLSGQAPNPATEADCPTYSPLAPGTIEATSGLAAGSGCVYPHAVQTLADQVSTASLTWRAYMQDMSPPGTSPAETCVHPAPGETVPPASPQRGADYLAFRDPFVYFDSLLESGSCAGDVVDLAQLATDLKAPAGPPALSWITPGACDDGAAGACAQATPSPAKASAVAPADAFLEGVVTEIISTPEYKAHGLVVITYDSGAPGAGANATVGALLLSPFVNPGAHVETAFTDYSLLKGFERLFGVPALGHAADPGLPELGAGVYRSSASG